MIKGETGPVIVNAAIRTISSAITESGAIRLLTHIKSGAFGSLTYIESRAFRRVKSCNLYMNQLQH